MNASHHWLWTDLETTGLDPATGRILEFAVILANDGADGDMSVVEEYTGVLSLPWEERKLLDVAPFVTRMHANNGLWVACTESATTLTEAEDFLLSLAESSEPRSIVLAGNSVHFDHRWLCYHMPRFAKFLSHRVLDVSSLIAAARAWIGPFESTSPIGEHRALGDIRASLDSARRLRELFGCGFGGAS
jgi:oligoribonuclease